MEIDYKKLEEKGIKKLFARLALPFVAYGRKKALKKKRRNRLLIVFAAICVVLIPILSLSSAVRNKNTIKNLGRNTDAKELVIDTVKNVAKDTAKFFEIIK